MAKNYMPCYNEIFHIPLMISLPGMTETTRCSALTQNIDLMPTVLDFHGADASGCWHPLHGKSLLPLIRGEETAVRETVIYGMYGRQVNICDGRYTYFRAPAREDNAPLNLYTAMPSTIWSYWDYDRITDLSKIEAGPFLSYTKYPVFRIPHSVTNMKGGTQDFRRRYGTAGSDLLFDLAQDPGQEHPLHDPELEALMCRKLVAAMKGHDSPPEQFTRLGLEGYL